MFPLLYQIHDTDISGFLEGKGLQLNISKVYHIKWT